MQLLFRLVDVVPCDKRRLCAVYDENVMLGIFDVDPGPPGRVTMIACHVMSCLSAWTAAGLQTGSVGRRTAAGYRVQQEDCRLEQGRHPPLLFCLGHHPLGVGRCWGTLCTLRVPIQYEATEEAAEESVFGIGL
ncbi:hypothetical protein B296_00005480 [Ensete ventricosum]|uniref:Uncharacterized protein n=1 Tax=Ensete ventricosum TaxID=4639 RepID=A0A426ZVS7_ENSVE|nr:hypothetical protein B296_00005480 [Ensete ventricosum]